ncbi:uncharacterized protein LOC133729741 [Rosa rugosa]|uniref:uncharacterized protein LOC133729741 n=1 Tax=Rosa rugosa TaxID=74645 RepID=UPI002B4181D9|nr:uncharacterized protein LOC133729741 [Rosa rugosa]
MSKPKLDFPILDSTGSEYHSWVTDVENHLTSKGILPVIQAPNPDLIFERTATNNATALILMRRHMDKSLRLEYMAIKDARELWVALEERFGNIQDTLLPDLKVRWGNLRFADFKSVAEYNSEVLRLKTMLGFCGQPVTEQELIEKTLSTFPVSAILLSKQYRTEFNTGRITRFHQLINIMSVAEKHDNILVRNYNSRPIGTKSVQEANYNHAPKGGRKERNPKNKGHNGRFGPYNRPTKEGNRQNEGRTRGNTWQRGRGGRGAPGRGGAAQGRGNGANPTRGRHPSANNAPQLRGGNHNDMCHRCGSSEHWFKQCNASKQLAAHYRAYRDFREHEANLAEEEEDGDDANVNLTIADFKSDKELHKDAADFD